MPRIARPLLLTVAVVVTGATIGLSILSFVRKVETFARAGFTSERVGGGLVVTSVEPESAAATASIAPGDRIITADGQAAASLPRPEKTLARDPFPHRLVISRGDGDIREYLLGKPKLSIDRTYLFLALVGLLYLLIGLYTAARERVAAARVFWALCLASFAVFLLTPAGPHDALWKAILLGEDLFRAVLPALFLHFFLVFPRPFLHGRVLPLLYLPGAAYLALQEAPLLGWSRDPGRALEWATRFWWAYFGICTAAVLLRLAQLLLARRREQAESEKQIRWIGLGVIVGLSPFLLLSALPRIFGLTPPFLSNLAVLPLVAIPLAFAYAILKWRLWDVEIFVREALATTAAVLLGGMTFLLVNALLDRAFAQMAEAGKNVVAFGSGLVLASLLVPMKKRITGVLERLQYHETYRARRALLDIARDFSTPRPREELVGSIVQRIEEGLHVVPCHLLLLEQPRDPEGRLLADRLETQDIWRLRVSAFEEEPSGAAALLFAGGYRTFVALRCAGVLVGALGVGHKDGRVPLSSEDESLLLAVMAQAGLAYENARLYGALAERLEEIRTLQQHQESVIRSSSSGILVLDTDGRLHSANPAFAALTGQSESELLGRPLAQVLPGTVLPPLSEHAEETVETTFRDPRGEERALRVSVSALDGNSDRRVVLVDDVTDRVRAERAFAERERLASLGVLAAGVAHEVNTPIAGLSSYAQLLLADTAPGDPRYAILKKMERQTFRAAHLVNNLLEFARPRLTARIKVDLKTVLGNAAESVETSLAGRRLSVEMAEEERPVWVLGDPRELEQVFVNLFTNARDASREGDEITCRLRIEGDAARVAVLDRGRGLDGEAGERLFAPFFSTKKAGGTGLGLAISRDIVHRHGGEIRLEPRPGGGAEALVTLPLGARES